MKVSIILPVYNGSKFIAKAITSVLGQSFSDYEFLVIDDGSKDNTGEIIQKFSSKDPRIRYVHQGDNRGFQYTLNHGLSLAKGEYISRIDDDDVWIFEDKLRRQVEFLDNHPQHVLLGTWCIITDGKGKELNRHTPPETDQQIRHMILRSNVFYHSTVMFRKEAAIQVGGYNYVNATVADYDFWLKLGTIGQLANLPIFAMTYTHRSGNMCSIKILEQLRNILILITRYRKEYHSYYYSLIRRCVPYVLYTTIGYSRYPRWRARLRKDFERIRKLIRRR